MPVAKSSSKKPTRSRTAATLQREKTGGVRILELPSFSKLPFLIHGFSTRPGGVSDFKGEKVLNLGFADWDSRENVGENRRRFRSALGAADLPLLTLKQIHSALLRPFSDSPKQPCKGDASATNTPGLLLAVQTADCVPADLDANRCGPHQHFDLHAAGIAHVQDHILDLGDREAVFLRSDNVVAGLQPGRIEGAVTRGDCLALQALVHVEKGDVNSGEGSARLIGDRARDAGTLRMRTCDR